MSNLHMDANLTQSVMTLTSTPDSFSVAAIKIYFCDIIDCPPPTFYTYS